MASAESVTEQFSAFGVDVDGTVLNKCVDLCISNGLDPETFVEQWMAFSISHHNGAAPSLDLLEAMERKELSKKDLTKTFHYQSPMTEKVPVYKDADTESQNEDSLADYYCTTPKSKKLSDHITPKSARMKVEGTPLSSLCPATHSPSINLSDKYASRTNSGDVVCRFGNPDNLESSVWSNMVDETCQIRQLPNHSGNILTTKAMYGFELLQEKASLLDSNIQYLSQHILHKADVKESVSVKAKSQIPVTVVGRIDCDSNGRLNPKSVLLQGTWKDSTGHVIPLDLDQLNQYALFPGQIVAMKGLNLRGDKFMVQEVHYDASYSKPVKINSEESVSGTLQMVIACGPYTTSDSLMYEPLTDLIVYITKHKPHAVVMIGPFMDANHQMVMDNTIAETYKSYFEKLIDKVMNAVESASRHTQVMMVASSKDVFHTNIYPTPAFNIRKKYPNLTMLPDPCCVSIGGVTMGITSTDILMHLSKEEISLPVQGRDKLGRLAGHLLNQQNFYPLWPPSPTLSVDTALWNEFAHMAATPHVLVLPSDLRYFAKDINGCVVINPERATKGIGGGTFARVQLNPHSDTQDILCQILRL